MNRIIQHYLLQKSRRGFTLIELIVTIFIIATLLAVGVGTIKSVASSKNVNTGVTLAENLFEHARNLAKNHDAACVIIYADSSSPNKEKRALYLRGMAVASGVKTSSNANVSDPNSYTWTIANADVVLPKNTYFNEHLSSQHGATVQTALTPFPGFSGNKRCYFYIFNSEGLLVSPDIPQSGSSQSAAASTRANFVIQFGQLLPGKTIPKEMPKRSRDVGGFRVWRSGKTSIFRSPSQISATDIGFQ